MAYSLIFVVLTEIFITLRKNGGCILSSLGGRLTSGRQNLKILKSSELSFNLFITCAKQKQPVAVKRVLPSKVESML